LTLSNDLLTVYKVAWKFEFPSLRTRVLDVEKYLKKCAKSARVRRLVNLKATGEIFGWGF